MTARKIGAITARTAAEWPADHPLRRGARVYQDHEIPPNSFLIASTLGDKRTPPAAGEHDVIGACAHCRCPIVWRSSAPATLTPICIPCWARL